MSDSLLRNITSHVFENEMMSGLWGQELPTLQNVAFIYSCLFRGRVYVPNKAIKHLELGTSPDRPKLGVKLDDFVSSSPRIVSFSNSDRPGSASTSLPHSDSLFDHAVPLPYICEEHCSDVQLRSRYDHNAYRDLALSERASYIRANICPLITRCAEAFYEAPEGTYWAYPFFGSCNGAGVPCCTAENAWLEGRNNSRTSEFFLPSGRRGDHVPYT